MAAEELCFVLCTGRFFAARTKETSCNFIACTKGSGTVLATNYKKEGKDVIEEIL